jgi:hypothetical protein
VYKASRDCGQEQRFRFWNSEKDKMESSLEEALVTYLKVLCRQLPGETEKKSENPYTQKPICWSTWEPDYALQ